MSCEFALLSGRLCDFPPAVFHRLRRWNLARTALLLILGSSPMAEGIPAFFAAGRYGICLIILMALMFAASTVATYMVLCIVSTAGLQRVRLGAVERYGEVISGALIMLIGAVFWMAGSMTSWFIKAAMVWSKSEFYTAITSKF
jgi:hypothetical protein